MSFTAHGYRFHYLRRYREREREVCVNVKATIFEAMDRHTGTDILESPQLYHGLRVRVDIEIFILSSKSRSLYSTGIITNTLINTLWLV